MITLTYWARLKMEKWQALAVPPVLLPQDSAIFSNGDHPVTSVTQACNQGRGPGGLDSFILYIRLALFQCPLYSKRAFP